MKLWKTIFLSLLLWVNFAIANPAFADKPNLQDNPDYLEITDNLTKLLDSKANNSFPEGSTASQVEQKIVQLQLAKYIMETGASNTECRNETGKTLAVYGSKNKKANSTFDNSLYLLPNGQITDDDWNCEGIYLPNDVFINTYLTDGVTMKGLDSKNHCRYPSQRNHPASNNIARVMYPQIKACPSNANHK